MADALAIPLSVDKEKQILGINEEISSNELSDANPGLQKRVLRKCDLRVVPPCMIMFAVSFLDRVNIGNAKIQGLTEDLKMKGTDFNVVSLMIFIPFILLEVWYTTWILEIVTYSFRSLATLRSNASSLLSGCLFFFSDVVRVDDSQLVIKILTSVRNHDHSSRLHSEPGRPRWMSHSSRLL